MNSLTKIAFGIVAIALTFAACANPTNSSSGSSTTNSPTTGSITGKAIFSGLSDNSGILITADRIGSKGMTPRVERAVASRSLGARVFAAATTTDATGTYTINDLAPGKYTVYASSQNSAEKAISMVVLVTAGESVAVADLDLTPIGSITGTATLEGKCDYLGIVVYIAGTSYSAMTNADGAFTISSVPVGTGYTMVASMQGYNSTESTVSVAPLTATNAGNLNLTTFIPLATTGSVEGTAKLDGMSSGNAGIFVYLQGTSYITMSGSDGTFTITGVAPGTYSVVASMNGYTSATSSVTVAAGAAASAGNLILTTPSPTTGSVTGTAKLDGVANAGITVYLQGTSYITTSGTDGAFSITGVAPGTYSAAASMDGYTSATSSSITVVAGEGMNAGTLNLTTLLPTMGSVTGTAKLDGVGSAGITLYLQGTSNITMSGSDGAFTLSGVAPGTYSAVASMNGYTSATSSVTVVAGGAASAGTLNLTTPSPTTGSVTGTTKLDGIGSAGITVNLQGTSYMTTSGTDGAFTITGVAPGTYSAVASKDKCMQVGDCSVNVSAGMSSPIGILDLFSEYGSEYSSSYGGTMKFVPGGRWGSSTQSFAVSSFHMSQNPITRAQFAAVMGTDPSDVSCSTGTSDPVQMVSWYMAIAFCNKLSLAEGRTMAYSVLGVDFNTLDFSSIPTAGNGVWDAATLNSSADGYRLPRVQEYTWAMAGGLRDTRAGDIVGGINIHTLKGYSGSQEPGTANWVIDAYAWCSQNTAKTTTHPVGSLAGNELGLYDLSGNVAEWIWEHEFGSAGRTCGGGFNQPGLYCSSGSWWYATAYCKNNIGFRVVAP